MSLDLTLKNREFNFNVTNSSQHKVYEFEEFRLDATTRLLYRVGEQLVLTPKAVETLIALVERQGTVVAKEELMQEIWADTIVEESNLAQYLHVLRKTLGDTSDGKPYIETLKRRGYRFNGAVRVVSNVDSVSAPAANVGDDRSKVANPIPRRIERRGNLQPFSQRDALRETSHPVNVERSDNIYTVSDWRREPVADTTLPVMPPARSQLVFTDGPSGLSGRIRGDRFWCLQIFDDGSERQFAKRSFSGIGHDAAHNNRHVEEGSRHLARWEVCRTHYIRVGRREPLGTPGRGRKRHTDRSGVADATLFGSHSHQMAILFITSLWKETRARPNCFVSLCLAGRL